MVNFIPQMGPARKLDLDFHSLRVLVVNGISVLAEKAVLGTCGLW